MNVQPVSSAIGVPRYVVARRAPCSRAVAWAVPAAAVLLGAAVGLGSLPLLALAVIPLAVALVLQADGALMVFAVGFYLNLPVVIVHQTGAPGALASGLAILLLLPFFGYVVMARQPVVVTPALGLMGAYLAALILSATLAPGSGPETTSQIVTFITEGLVLCVLVLNTVRTTRTLRLALWSVAIAAGVMGLISLWQSLTHSYDNQLFGMAKVDRTGLQLASAALDGERPQPRLAGPIGEKNRYAQVLLVILPLAVYLVRFEARRSLRLVAAAAGALALCGMMLTLSRGAAVALAVLLLVTAAVGFIRIRFIVAAVTAMIALTLAVAPNYVERVQSLGAADSALSTDSTADGAVVGRATENLAAFHAFADHPLVGVGPGQYFRRYSQEYGNQLNLRFLETDRRAHNLYLEIAADTGIIGLATFLGIVGVTMLGLWRMNVVWRHRHPPHAHLALALLLSLVAYMASGVFLQLAYHRYFFFLVALANAGIWVLRREAIRAQLV